MPDGQGYDGPSVFSSGTEFSSEQSVEEEGPQSIEIYQDQLNNLVLDPDFFDQPYENQVEQVRDVYFGSRENPVDWEDEEDVLEQHTQAIAEIRDINEQYVKFDDYAQFLPPIPDLTIPQNREEADTLLDDWEEQSKATLRSKLGDVEYAEIQEAIEQEIADRVDGTKRFINEQNFYAPETLEGKPLEPGIDAAIEQSKEDLARFATAIKGAVLPPLSAISDSAARWVKTTPLLPTVPDAKQAKYDTPFGKFNEEELILGLGSGAGTIAMGAGLGRLGTAAGLGAKGQLATALVPLMSMGTRLAYKEAYDKAYRKTQNPEVASTAGWLNVPGGALDGIGDALVGMGIIPKWATQFGTKFTAKLFGRLSESGMLGKAIRNGFGVLGTAAFEGGQEGVQELLTGEAAALATGDPSLKTSARDIALATGIGAVTGGIAGGVSTLTPTNANEAFLLWARGKQQQQVEAQTVATEQQPVEIKKEQGPEVEQEVKGEVKETEEKAGEQLKTEETKTQPGAKPEVQVAQGETTPSKGQVGEVPEGERGRPVGEVVEERVSPTETPIEEEIISGLSSPRQIVPEQFPEFSRERAIAEQQFRQQKLEKEALESQVPENIIPEAVDMARLTPKVARIKPAPIVEGPIKPTKDIIFDASESLGANVQFKGKRKKNTLGTYYPGSAKTSIRYQGDLDTTAHELAHALDDKLGIVGKWAGKREKSPYDNELIDLFAPYGSATTKSPLVYKRAEGVAEYIRAWVVNPEETERLAPNFTKYFQKKVPKATLEALQSFGEDIRRFAGAKAEDQILANVRWKPLGAFDKMKSAMTGTKANGFEVTAYDKFSKAMLDSLRPFEQAVNYAREETGKVELLPRNDPMILARNYSGVNSKVEDIFEKGMINPQFERVTPGGFSYLFESLDTSSEKTLDKDAQDTSALMIAQRTIEKAQQFAGEAANKAIEAGETLDKANRKALQQLARTNISGIGGGLRSDYETAQAAIQSLQQDPNRYSRLQEAANRYREWSNANLRYLVDSGRMSEEAYNNITTNNEQYVAMQRIREIEPGRDLESVGIDSRTGKIGIAHEEIKKFKGSAADIKNPYISLMNSTANIVREADRNNIMRAFTDLLTTQRAMYQGEPNSLASIGTKATAEEPNTIKVWNNGEPTYWRFDKDIYESLKGLQESSKLPAWATFIPQLARAGVVYSPPFLVRNIIRDTSSRLMLTEGNTRDAVIETFKRHGPEDISNLKLYGGDQAGHYLSDSVNFSRALRAAMNDPELQKNSVFIDPRKVGEFVKKYPELVRSSEQFNRIREYKTAFKKAQEDHPEWSDLDAHLYAANQARGLLDFAVGGTFLKELNRIIPFTNPAVQGLRRTIKAGKVDPLGFSIRWTLFAALPTLATRLIAMAGDYEDEYDNLPAYQKDLFYNFKISDNFWLRIPKSYELGVLASGIERSISKALGNNKAFEGYGGSVARSMLPVDEAAFAGPFKGIVQALANHDFFRDRDIVPFYERNKALELRDSKNASRFGQMIQSMAENFGFGSSDIGKSLMDARVVDFLMKEQFGILGDLAVKTTDIGRQDISRRLNTSSLIGLTSGSPVYASRDVQWVFDFAENIGMGPKSKYLEQLKSLLDEYHQAKTDKIRDAVGERVRNEAARVRGIFESQSEGLDIQQTRERFTAPRRRQPTVRIPRELQNYVP